MTLHQVIVNLTLLNNTTTNFYKASEFENSDFQEEVEKPNLWGNQRSNFTPKRKFLLPNTTNMMHLSKMKMGSPNQPILSKRNSNQKLTKEENKENSMEESKE
jgi:hypothetical protein